MWVLLALVFLFCCISVTFLPSCLKPSIKCFLFFSPSFSKRPEKRFQLFGIRGNNPLMLLLGFPHLSCGLQYVEPYGIPVIVNWCYVNKKWLERCCKTVAMFISWILKKQRCSYLTGIFSTKTVTSTQHVFCDVATKWLTAVTFFCGDNGEHYSSEGGGDRASAGICVSPARHTTQSALCNGGALSGQ